MIQLSRKQRERLEREQLILDTAQHILYEKGYAHLTMERIADAVEYSKGTIYNHFTSKEDIICSLCCRCINNLIELFKAAANYPGNSRERFSAIGLGYMLYHQRRPLDAQYTQIVKSNAVREKLGPAKLQELDSLEKQVTGIAMDVVMHAIAQGDIPTTDNTTAESIVFGFWSMHYGAVLLEQSDIPLSELGFSPGQQLTWTIAQKFLDGFGWQPNSADMDSQRLLSTMVDLTTRLFDAQALPQHYNKQWHPPTGASHHG